MAHLHDMCLSHRHGKPKDLQHHHSEGKTMRALMWLALNSVVDLTFGCAGQQFKFAHCTLQGHTLAGEERFAVEWHQEDESVW